MYFTPEQHKSLLARTQKLFKKQAVCHMTASRLSYILVVLLRYIYLYFIGLYLSGLLLTGIF